jgi:hypothetical protein
MPLIAGETVACLRFIKGIRKAYAAAAAVYNYHYFLLY